MLNSKSRGLTEAARHYRSLFSLPRYSLVIGITIVISVIGSLGAFALAYNSLQRAIEGLVFSLQVLIIPTIIGDAILSNILFDDKVVLDKRRGAGLSLFVCVILVTTLMVGAVFQLVLKKPVLLSYASLFAVCLAILLRYLVVSTVTYLHRLKAAFTIILQPGLCFLSTLLFFNLWQTLVFAAVLISSCIILGFSYVFIKLIDRKGMQAVGIGAISLFKAFVANWVSGATQPIEEYLDRLGSNSTFLISLLAFNSKEIMKLIVVVPMIHPGPFNNVGSSNLPFLIQKVLEEQNNSVVAVPHGTCNHKSNLTSKWQCEKVLRGVVESSTFSDFKLTATRFVRFEQNQVKASCQIFGDVAFVTITCAPANMEDIPTEIGLRIIEQGKKIGTKDVIVIDAHNSTSNSKNLSVLSEDLLKNIIAVSENVVKKALEEEKHPFKVGVAKIYPNEFNVKEGFGPAGIVALTVAVDKQKVAYLIIDGNNMISGLREKALKELSDLVSDGEIMTTDTHVVNAIVSIDRGYHPVGEAVDEKKLIDYFRQGVSKALKNLDDATTAYRIVEIQDVKSLGEEVINISNLVDVTYNFLKTITPIIYIPSLIIAFLCFITILFNMKT
jgi:putative membrane protein